MNSNTLSWQGLDSSESPSSRPGICCKETPGGTAKVVVLVSFLNPKTLLESCQFSSYASSLAAVMKILALRGHGEVWEALQKLRTQILTRDIDQSLCMCVRMCAHVCHSTCAEVRLRIVRAGSSLPHCGIPRIELVYSGLAAKAFRP